MKTLSHLLLIVLAALLVAGATLVLVQTGSTSTASAEPPASSQIRPVETGDGEAFPVDKEAGERSSGSLFGLGDLAKNVLISGLLFLAVMFGSKVLDYVGGRLRRNSPPRLNPA